MKSWYGLQYCQDGAVVLGVVTRETGDGDWQAWRYHATQDNELLGSYPSADDAQRAVEEVFGMA